MNLYKMHSFPRMMKLQLPKPSTESLGLSEKGITRILRPKTFTEIPGGLDSLETVGENYFCPLIFSNKIACLNINNFIIWCIIIIIIIIVIITIIITIITTISKFSNLIGPQQA